MVGKMKEKADWCVVVKSQDNVSILKGLTETIARETVKRVEFPRSHNPWDIKEHVDSTIWFRKNPNKSRTYGGFGYNSSEVVKVWSFKSDGTDLVVWPKPENFDKDLAKALSHYDENGDKID